MLKKILSFCLKKQEEKKEDKNIGNFAADWNGENIFALSDEEKTKIKTACLSIKNEKQLFRIFAYHVDLSKYRQLEEKDNTPITVTAAEMEKQKRAGMLEIWETIEIFSAFEPENTNDFDKNMAI